MHYSASVLVSLLPSPRVGMGISFHNAGGLIMTWARLVTWVHYASSHARHHAACRQPGLNLTLNPAQRSKNATHVEHTQSDVNWSPRLSSPDGCNEPSIYISRASPCHLKSAHEALGPYPWNHIIAKLHVRSVPTLVGKSSTQIKRRPCQLHPQGAFPGLLHAGHFSRGCAE